MALKAHRYQDLIKRSLFLSPRKFYIVRTINTSYYVCHCKTKNDYLTNRFQLNKTLVRFFSNYPNEEDNKNKNPDSASINNNTKSLFQKGKNIVNVFWIGCKALFTDVRLAVHTRRKLGLYHQRDLTKLSREEVRHLRQTRQDVVKTFPVTLLFMVPFIGYVAPLIAYFYPKQLLSQQFWHPDQKKEIILEEYEKRSQYYFPLIKEVGSTCKKSNNEALYRLCIDILDGKHPSNDQLIPFKSIFTEIDDLTIQKMPRYHLIKICKCWLIPTAWYLPRWFMTNSLRKRIVRLQEDDTLIARDGTEILTPECIEQAVHVRGLDETSLCDRLNLHWLKQWISLSTQVTAEDVSFLAHCAVFKAANFEMIEKRNGTLEK